MSARAFAIGDRVVVAGGATPESEAEDSPEWRAWLACSFDGGTFRRVTVDETGDVARGEFYWL